jgi:predicted PurR-regulated permease PerM
LPPERRGTVRSMLPRAVPLLRRYLIGVAGVVAFTAAAAWIGFGLIFHLPHAVLLAIVVGALEIIPALGPFASAVLVGLTAIQQHSIWAAVGLGAYAVALRLVIDNLVGPLLLGRAARVHPVVVIFAFVLGASLFGVIGLLLAVPVAACTKMALQAYYAEPIEEEADAARTPGRAG